MSPGRPPAPCNDDDVYPLILPLGLLAGWPAAAVWLPSPRSVTMADEALSLDGSDGHSYVLIRLRDVLNVLGQNETNPSVSGAIGLTVEAAGTSV